MEEVVVKYKAEVAGFRKELDDIKRRMGMVDEAAEKSAQKTTSAHKKAASDVGGSYSQLMGNITKVGAAVGIAFGVQQVLQFGKHILDVGLKAEGIHNAFEKLNSPGLLDQLRVATKGTVDDLTLMQGAVKANNFKIPLDQLGKLFQFAQQRARETGESVEYLTQSIVLGISRKSIPIIDNLGLSAVEVQNEMKKTGDFASAVGTIIDREMSKSGESTDLAADKVGRLSAWWGNVKEGLGTFVTDGINFLGDFVNYVANGFAPPVEDGFKNVGDAVDSTGKKIKDIFDPNKWSTAQLQKAIDDIQKNAGQDAGLSKFQQGQIDQFQKILDFRKASENNAKNEIETLASLTQELENLNLVLQGTDIKSQAYHETLASIKEIEDKITQAKGEQTEAEKKAAAEREKNAEKKKQDQEKEKQRLADLLKAQQKFNEEIYKASQDARNQELIDLDAKARQMLESGLDQLKVDEFIRGEEIKINDKYDKISEDQHKETQDKMLADLELLVDPVLDTQKRITENQKEELEKRRAAMQQYVAAASSLITSLFELGTALREAESQEIGKREEDELAALDKKFGIKKEQETEYERQRRLVQEKFAKEQAELKRKQAIADKAQAAYNIALSTAQGVIAALASVPPNVPLSVAIGIAGAIEAAAVLAKPIPEFEKGGRIKGGKQIIQVNEKGEEFVAKAEATRKYSKELEAMNSGRFEEYLTTHRVLPMLTKMHRVREQLNQKEKSDLKRVIKAQFDDTGLRHDIRKPTKLDDDTIKKLARALRSGNNERLTP